MEKPRDSAPPPSLREALRRARAASAEKSGAVVELRTAELARLDLLKEQLEPVFAQAPQEVDLFDAAILPGEPARLFVDVLGFVEMDRDKRTFRFFNDTRYGRKLIAESDKLPVITQAITDYVAHRLVEREKALISDLGTFPPQPANTLLPAMSELRISEEWTSWAGLAVAALAAGVLAYWGAGLLLAR